MVKFEKVSYPQFLNDYRELFPKSKLLDQDIYSMWDDIVVPTRGTEKSAGYDFVAVWDMELTKQKDYPILTGIKVAVEPYQCVDLLPKSGLGTKYRLQFNNTVGLIDADYYNCDKNEGHIMGTLYADRKRTLLDILLRRKIKIEKGRSMFQGKISQYYVTDDDSASGIRNGGFDSTYEKIVSKN